MAAVTNDDLFDLARTVGGQRFEDFEFVLLDNGKNPIGQLAVSETASPRIDFDTARSTMRTATGLQIAASDLSHVDVRRDRVMPRAVLQNGQRVELGVLMFGEDVREPHAGYTQWTPALYDEGLLLSQDLDHTYSLAPSGSILGLLTQALNEVGIEVIAGVADRATPTALVFPATTQRINMVNALAAALGGFPPFLNNHGQCVLKPIPSDGTGPDHVYEFGGRILDGTPKITKSNFKAPNRYIVSNGDPTSPVIGVYDLPPSAPNSAAQTGNVVTNTTTWQGMTAAVANDVAKAVALTDTSTYETATFSSLFDARHDGFDIVQLFGVLYLETGFSFSCVPGGAMTHTLTGIYA